MFWVKSQCKSGFRHTGLETGRWFVFPDWLVIGHWGLVVFARWNQSQKGCRTKKTPWDCCGYQRIAMQCSLHGRFQFHRQHKVSNRERFGPKTESCTCWNVLNAALRHNLYSEGVCRQISILHATCKPLWQSAIDTVYLTVTTFT